jgi:uncharacterized protein (TIGR00369 family)
MTPTRDSCSSLCLATTNAKLEAKVDMNSPEPPPTTSVTPLTQLNRIIRENRIAEYRSPALELGMRPTQFGSGTAAWSWNDQPPLVINPFGTIGGGFVAVFVDELFSTAIGSVIEQDEWAMTAEVKISHLRPLRPGAITGNARVLRRGRAIAFLEAEIFGADVNLAVRASSTWSISH